MKIADDKIQELERALLETQVSYPLLNGFLFDLCEGECRVVWGGQQKFRQIAFFSSNPTICQ